MSLITSLFSWLFGSSTTSTDTATIESDQPCRYRLDNGTSATLTLPDGRKLGYAQYGSPTGKAILYHHGFPGSRLEGAQHHELCMELGLRMICIDRPGIGWSSPHPGSTLLDWPTDIEYLTEHLGLESYSVLGVSGGGPTTLACGYALPPSKLKCISLVCATGPPDIGWRGADIGHQIGWPYGIRYAPYWMGRMLWRAHAIGRLDLPESQRLKLLLKEGESAPACDRDFMGDVNLMRLCVRAQGEAFAQGYDYVWDDGKKNANEFGFRLQDMRQDLKVQMWYGEKDYFVPISHGLKIAARLGERVSLRVEDESHGGILMHHKREILEALRDTM
ncbi:Alpha/Beta hydrolase protein [Phaeosphaeria sp. MPI-PUGE-AT-0046c]|nr:Alpha/Beta hydrolase protein [Phaeosphaeria sp. MPI-PUGE-AT-0046c]